MSQNQTLRHTARDAVKAAYKADSSNVAVNLLTANALVNLRGVTGASPEVRKSRVDNAVAFLTSAATLTTSADAKQSLTEAVEALGEVTFPESSYVPPTYTGWDFSGTDFDDDFDEDDDEE